MKRCKSKGESKNSRSVVNEDKISELPEALILKILCILPIKDAIVTSVLSKQWQSLWKMMPILKFESNHHHIRQLENVYKSFLLHKAPVLQSFQLSVPFKRCNVVDTDTWIRFALTRNVRELVLAIDSFQAFLKFPTSLYNCETLETLKLRSWITIDVPSKVCLKSLRTLHLHDVDFKDDESVLKLLSGCPNLQNLEVHRRPCSRLKTFTIAVPSLQRLSIHNGCVTQPLWGYVINAPCLKYLNIVGFKALKSCLIENVPELVEASISIEVSDHIINENLLGPLTSVTRLSLSLSPLKIKLPTGSIFYQLVSLDLHTNKEAWGNLLNIMLGSSPKLQVLKLYGHKGRRRADIVADGEWNQPKNVPECLLLHLETFTWKGFKWQQEEEREVAKYILKNSNHLKRSTFSSSRRISSKVAKDLKGVVKDKNSCRFISGRMKHID